VKAFVLGSYGSSSAVRLEDVPQPVPGASEVLVRVRAASVNPLDWHTMRGEPRIARLMGGGLGLRGPQHPRLGADMAGEVVAVGPDVAGFRPGDGVYAALPHGAFAEFACAGEDRLARMPGNLTFLQAAAVPVAGITALLAVRDVGLVQAGQTVLVNGASGGVGTFAVQLAHALGAHVTAVCSGRNADLVRSIGADEVLDYTGVDYTRSGRRYDVVLDVWGGHSFWASRRLLTPKGSYVAVGGPAGRWLQPAGHMFSALAMGPFVSQRVGLVDATGADHGQALRSLTELIEAGDVAPVIDRTYPFQEVPAAIAYQELGHSPGKVVITF
jgi:NADPH:quinone reductase-like Zn-dependent oxidoreductase